MAISKGQAQKNKIYQDKDTNIKFNEFTDEELIDIYKFCVIHAIDLKYNNMNCDTILIICDAISERARILLKSRLLSCIQYRPITTDLQARIFDKIIKKEDFNIYIILCPDFNLISNIELYLSQLSICTNIQHAELIIKALSYLYKLRIINEHNIERKFSIFKSILDCMIEIDIKECIKVLSRYYNVYSYDLSDPNNRAHYFKSKLLELLRESDTEKENIKTSEKLLEQRITEIENNKKIGLLQLKELLPAITVFINNDMPDDANYMFKTILDKLEYGAKPYKVLITLHNFVHTNISTISEDNIDYLNITIKAFTHIMFKELQIS